jgi:hypothetical protein
VTARVAPATAVRASERQDAAFGQAFRPACERGCPNDDTDDAAGYWTSMSAQASF